MGHAHVAGRVGFVLAALGCIVACVTHRSLAVNEERTNQARRLLASSTEVRMHKHLFAVAITSMLASCSGEVETVPPTPPPETITTSFELRSDMRELWTQHVLWTRIVIMSSVAGLPDAGAAVERLLRNQDDIGDAIRPFYGDAAGDELTRLLREHITIALDVVYGASVGNADAAIAAWYANAEDIAQFLANANPAWALEETRAMMRIHLDQTIIEASARLEGDHPLDVAAFDAIVGHALHMADMLADGVAAQFPELVGEHQLSARDQALFFTMRKLWEDHVMWTRIFIVASIAELPDAPFAGARLLQNQDDIGEALSAFYGAAAGGEIARLFREHITIAADVVYGAAIADGPATQAALAAWRVNADDIAAYLASLNSEWSFGDLQAMMYTHLDQTTAEATARINADWERDVAIYDEIEQHILHMSDTLSAGIVAQHPSAIR